MISSNTENLPTNNAIISEKSANIAISGFLQVMEAWGVNNEEALVLLGSPSRRTFYNWKAGKVGRLPVDVISRISYVLGIFKALNILYADERLADDWVTRPNAHFGGETPLRRMLGGDVADLYAVRQYLDGVRGGWN